MRTAKVSHAENSIWKVHAEPIPEQGIPAHCDPIEAVARKKVDAKENLEKAQAMDKKQEIKNEQKPIVREIKSLLGA
jgi:hypothetical protein